MNRVKYVDLHCPLLDLSGCSDSFSHGKAWKTHSHELNKLSNKKKNSERPNPTRPGRTKPPKVDQCYYSKSHKHPHAGHTHTFCNRLKSGHNDSVSSAPPAATTRDVVPYHATLTVNEQYAHGVASIISSLRHAVPPIPAGCVFQRPNDETYIVWILEKGASFHITCDFSHLLLPISCHEGTRVGGGACSHAAHMESLQLYMKIAGSVLSITLADVLNVFDWHDACLISWPEMDMLGSFHIVREDAAITVPRKSSHTPVFIAQLMHGCYQVLHLVHHYNIYAIATDFGHPPLGDESTRCCSPATNIYANRSISPKRTSEFFCPAGAKYNSTHSVSLPGSNLQSKNLLELIYSHFRRFLSIASLWRHKYMLTFVEDKRRYSDIYYLHKKSDAAGLIKALYENV